MISQSGNRTCECNTTANIDALNLKWIDSIKQGEVSCKAKLIFNLALIRVRAGGILKDKQGSGNSKHK